MYCIQRKSFKITFISRNLCHFSHCLSSGCKSKISQTRYLKQQTVYHSSRRLRGPRLGVGKAGSWLSPGFLMAASFLCPHKWKKEFLPLSIWTLSHNRTASKPNHLIKAPPAHTITLGIWASHMNFGKHIQSITAREIFFKCSLLKEILYW